MSIQRKMAVTHCWPVSVFSIQYSVSLIAFTSNYRFACYCNFSVGNLSCTFFSSIFVRLVFARSSSFLFLIFLLFFFVHCLCCFVYSRCILLFTSIRKVHSSHFIRRKQTKTLFLSVGRPMSGLVNSSCTTWHLFHLIQQHCFHYKIHLSNFHLKRHIHMYVYIHTNSGVPSPKTEAGAFDAYVCFTNGNLIPFEIENKARNIKIFVLLFFRGDFFFFSWWERVMYMELGVLKSARE